MFNEQKKYFKQKLNGVKKMIWDLEFKRHKTREIREEVRVEYDTTKSRLSSIELQIKEQTEKPTLDKGEIARLDDTKVLMEKKIKDFEVQMSDLDTEIIGTKSNDRYPEGLVGINDQLEALRELITMLNKYIKTL